MEPTNWRRRERRAGAYLHQMTSRGVRKPHSRGKGKGTSFHHPETNCIVEEKRRGAGGKFRKGNGKGA